MSNRCRPTRASFWSAWKSRTSTRSTASRRRWRSGRKIPRAIRAPPSRRRPSCTIFCACCGPAPGGRIARTAESTWSATRWITSRENAGAAGRVALVRAVPGAAGKDHRSLRDRLFDLRKKGFNRLYPGRQGVRILDARIAAGRRFLKARIRPGGSPRDLGGDVRQRWSIPSKSVIAKRAKRFSSRRGGGESLRFNEKFTCKTLRQGIRRARAEPVQLQQSLRRLQALPGIRQHHRLRHGSGDPGPVADRSQKGAVDPWTKPQHSWYLEEFRQAARGQGSADTFPISNCAPTSARCCTSTSAATSRKSNEEIQSPRARVPQPLSRLHGRARIAAGRACVRKRCTFASAGRTWPTWSRMNIAEAQTFFCT